MDKKDLSLFSHQKKTSEGLYTSSFLFVHDDTFGRTFATAEEILEYLKPTGVVMNVQIVSMYDGYINIFYLTVTYDFPLEGVSELEDIHHLFKYMHYVTYYYSGYPCNLNLIIDKLNNIPN